MIDTENLCHLSNYVRVTSPQLTAFNSQHMDLLTVLITVHCLLSTVIKVLRGNYPGESTYLDCPLETPTSDKNEKCIPDLAVEAQCILKGTTGPKIIFSSTSILRSDSYIFREKHTIAPEIYCTLNFTEILYS